MEIDNGIRPEDLKHMLSGTTVLKLTNTYQDLGSGFTYVQKLLSGTMGIFGPKVKLAKVLFFILASR